MILYDMRGLFAFKFLGIRKCNDTGRPSVCNIDYYISNIIIFLCIMITVSNYDTGKQDLL
jgi:hypothetical protein